MKLYKAREVGEKFLNCSESHVYKLDEEGLMPASYEWPCIQSKKGKRPKYMKRWTVADIEKFLAKHKKEDKDN